MKVKMYLIGLLLAFATTAYAQQAVNSANWEILNSFSLKLQNNKYVIFYPPQLKALDNKVIELSGYMIPIKVGKNHKEFLLSVLPVEQCAFCGSGQYAPMVIIKAAKPVSYTDQVICMKGTFMLNDLGNTQHEYAMINAVITPLKK